MSVKVKNFVWQKGVNDAEYIEKLQSVLKAQEETINHAVAKIRKLSKNQKEGWHPVTEPPIPEEGKDIVEVLVTCDFGDTKMVYTAMYAPDIRKVCGYAQEKKRSALLLDDPEWGRYEVNFVTAWMPLPAPYERKEKE